MRRLKRIARLVAALLVIPIVLVGALLAFVQTAPGRALVVSLVESLASSDDTTLSIGRLEGRIPFDMTVFDVTMADRGGVWLDVDRARLAWRPFALAAGTLSIETVDIGAVSLSRLPEPSGSESGGGMPTLPFDVELDRLEVARIAIGEPVLGVPAAVTVEGDARLGRPRDGLGLNLRVERVDGTPGRIDAALAWRPQDETLDLDLTVDEPAGGLVSRLSGFAGLPPIRLAVEGSGPIDDWRAGLDLAAGDRGTATGTAAIVRGPDGRRLTVDLEADASGLLDLAYAPLAAGRSTLSAEALFRDDGPIDIARLELLTAAGLVSLNGRLDPASGAVALDYEAVAGEAGRFAMVLPLSASWAGIELAGTLDGTLSQPVVAATLDGEGLALDGNRVEALHLALRLDAQGPVSDPGSAVAVSLQGRMDGLASADRSLGAATGESVGLRVRGTATPAGRFDADEARIAIGAGEIVWAGRVDPQGLDGRLTTRDFDLAALAGLAGIDLAGRAALDARIAGRFDGSALAVTLDGRTEGFSSGLAVLDGALGPAVAVTGGLRRDPDGSFGFEDLTIEGAALSVTANGSADRARADVVAAIDLPDLARLDERVEGAAAVTVRLTGSLEDLALDLEAAVDEATAMGRPVAGLKLKVDATNVTRAPEGTLSLAGRVDGRQVSGRGRLSAPQGAEGGLAGLAVRGLDIVVGSVRLAGDVTFDARARGTGSLVLKASDLADLSTFALTEMRGTLDATVDLAVEDGVQVVRATAAARDVRAFDLRIAQADLTGTLRDPAGRLVVDADLNARALDVGGTRIETLALAARGGVSENDVTLAATGLGARLEARAGVALAGGDATIALSALTLSGGGHTATLAAPATVRVTGGDVSIDRLSLRTGGGSLDIDGRAGGTLDLRVAARALPLALADIAMPGTGIAGTLSGQATLSGEAAAPRGRYTVQVAGLLLPAMRQAGFAGIDIAADGELLGERASIDARITGPAGAALNVSGSAPLDAEGALDLAVRGRIDLAMLNDMLAASGDRVSGPVDIDMRITGRADAPDAGGTIRLAGGSYVSPLNGVSFDQIALEARGGTQAIEITRFSARARNGGTVTGSGTVRLDAAAGFPADIRISADNAEVVSSDIVAATVDAALTLTGPVATRPALAGTVTIRRMDITLPNRLPHTVTPIPVQHVNEPPEIAARLAREAAAQERSGGGGIVAALDLTVTTTNRIFVRGQGVDAQLGGQVTVRGTTAVPIVIGAFELQRGEIQVLTQRLELTRGRVSFSGGDRIDPLLDFVAQTRTSSVTAQVAVTGTASQPVFTFSSSPELPQDEVLSRILFDKATGSLSPGEAIQLAQAAAQLAGLTGGSGGLVDGIRQKLGLDVLQLTSSGDDPAIGVGRYINDNIYVGVTQGVKPDSSRVTVDIDLTRNIKARGAVGADGSSSVGVNIEWDY